MAIKSAIYGLLGATAFAAITAGTAQAGSCGGVGNCDTGTVYTQSLYGADYGPTTVRGGTPYDRFSSINFQRAPHVEIMRIHGLSGPVGLDDAPHGNTGGCFGHAEGYCRGGHAAPAPLKVEMFGQPGLPVMPAPVLPAPVFAAPVALAPLPTERVVAVGGGFDPSKFAPRTYGDLSITPGIVHAPTSIVDRDPGRAQAALDQIAPGSVTPALSGVPIRHGVPYAAPYRLDPVPNAVPADAPPAGVVPWYNPGAPRIAASFGAPVMSGSVVNVPAPGLALAGAPMLGGTVPTGLPGAAGAPVLQADGTYASQVGVDGTYWEKVSGVTMFGDTVATSVICKRKLPTQTVNPVVGVPYPVPTPVPGPVVDVCDTHPLKHYEGRARY